MSGERIADVPRGKGGLGEDHCWLPPAARPRTSGEALSREAADLIERLAPLFEPRAPAILVAATDAEVEDLSRRSARVASRLRVEASPSAQAAAFDHRFRLVRSASPDVAAVMLTRATLIAISFCNDPAADPADAENIFECLAASVAARLRPDLPASRGFLHDPLFAPPPMSPLERWNSGHQLFSALGSEAINALQGVVRMLDEEAWNAADAAYSNAIQAFHAIGAAMRITGAMSAQDYASVVRPSMEPPFAPSGFSGLFDPTHARILALTRQIARKPHPYPIHRLQAGFHRAVNRLYHAHVHICAEVAGDVASLASQGRQLAPPGHENLKKFCRRALNGAGFSKEG